VNCSSIRTEAIEIEQGTLWKAHSLALCLKISLEYGDNSSKGPYYPDMMDVLAELIRRGANGIDSVKLGSFVSSTARRPDE